jgi:hypothetical protein
MLVVNRPAGLLSLLDGYDPQKPQLRSLLLPPPFGRPWIAPRLDGDPSLRDSLP